MIEESDKIKATNLEQYLEESRGLERDYIGEILSSRKNAWRITWGLCMVAILSLITAIAGVKRQSPPPVILRVDNATGSVDMLTTIRESESSYGEVVDIYWLNKYVLNRESYDYYNIQMLYETTALLSTENVQKEYSAIFDGSEARDKVLADHTRIVVVVNSIVPTNQGGNAIVRFTTQEKKINGQANSLRNFIATISYRYTSSPIGAEDRRINPLGFQVTSYRVDPEYLAH